jgi:hypothetical protein
VTTAEQLQAEAKRRNDVRRAEIKARIGREWAARQMVIERAGVSKADLLAAARVLSAIANVNLDDLRVPPGFNVLPDGEVGSVNADTHEWQHWSTANTLREDAGHIANVLYRTA